jgi:histidyl-tRNA synthetase
MKPQPIRGTRDIFGEDMRSFQHVVNTARSIGLRFGFEEIATPIIEFTQTFKRTLGDTSDIVSKEMYSFEDRGGEGITLRPEFTAGVARAFISGGMTQNLPCKLFSTGPLFRYERPQKGRYRQFHQVNFELMGPKEVEADIEVISLAAMLLDALGIASKTELELNSLGDDESRAAYRDALVAYLSKYKNDLSEDSKQRLERNPMRILDSKDETDKKITADAPTLDEYYNDTTKAFFADLQNGLTALGIRYRINPKLVRGLDYYCHTAFEFTTQDLGSQNAVLAGGRYDKLIGMMGGTETPAVGFGGGIERMALLLDTIPAAPRPIASVHIGEEAEREAQKLAYHLRSEGFTIDIAYNGNPGKRMKRANKINAIATLILGEDELKSGSVTVKQMDLGTEEKVATGTLLDWLGRV